MPVHKIVDVVSVGNAFVLTRRTVNVSLLMAAAVVRWRAGGWMLGADLEHVVVHVVAVYVMEVPVVQIVDVISVLDGDMPAT